jgi:hypothetical protein
VEPNFLILAQNMKVGLAGLPFLNLCLMFLRKKQICTLDSQEQSIIVKNAAGIMAMYLKTVQNLPENVIATTACVYFLNQRVK